MVPWRFNFDPHPYDVQSLECSICNILYIVRAVPSVAGERTELMILSERILPAAGSKQPTRQKDAKCSPVRYDCKVVSRHRSQRSG